MSKLHIITVATSSHYYLPYLKISCNNNGIPLTILGFGEKWKGFNWRFKLVLNYLKNLDENDIACFVDGYDVICTRNLNELSNVFFKLKNKYKCKVIVAEDKRKVNKIINFLMNFYFSKCNNKSLNAGTYIGQVKDLIEVLEKIYNLYPIDNADDQMLLTKYCNKYKNDVYIDINNELFLTLINPYLEIDKYLTFKNNIPLYNNNAPFFIHGPGETYLDNIIKKVDYDYYIKNKRVSITLKKHKFNKYIFRIKNIMTVRYIAALILTIIFIYLIFIIYIK